MIARKLGRMALAILPFVAYLAAIVLGNVAFATLGVVTVGFGYMAPAAVYFVGLSLVGRDWVQERLGKKWTVAAIAAGAGLSAFVSPALALASGAAFAVSETLDFAVYTPLRKRGFLKAVLASNAVGMVADSLVFLTLAFGSLAFLPGQIIGKATSTIAAVAVMYAVRKLRAHRISAARPVYLAGPINGATDAEAMDWRVQATAVLGNVLDPMARDYRGKEDESVADIVEGDKADIGSCRAVVAYCPKPSVGTSMEVLYAFERGIPVHVVVPDGAPVSPWLRYHATTVSDSLALTLHALTA